MGIIIVGIKVFLNFDFGAANVTYLEYTFPDRDEVVSNDFPMKTKSKTFQSINCRQPRSNSSPINYLSGLITV